MPRLALFNICIGFIVLFLAAAAGAFIATDLTAGFLKDKAFVDSWAVMLSKSAHGHSNLFALTHIAFGLTMPYSRFSARVKLCQTIGLGLGTLAMGPILVARALHGPTESLDLLEIAIGSMLSCALLMMFSHAAGIAATLLKRA